MLNARKYSHRTEDRHEIAKITDILCGAICTVLSIQ